MNKQDLIAIVAEENELSKAQAARAIDSIFDAITMAVAKGEGFQLIGFGTLLVRVAILQQTKKSRSRQRVCRNLFLAPPLRMPSRNKDRFESFCLTHPGWFPNRDFFTG